MAKFGEFLSGDPIAGLRHGACSGSVAPGLGTAGASGSLWKPPPPRPVGWPGGAAALSQETRFGVAGDVSIAAVDADVPLLLDSAFAAYDRPGFMVLHRDVVEQVQRATIAQQSEIQRLRAKHERLADWPLRRQALLDRIAEKSEVDGNLADISQHEETMARTRQEMDRLHAERALLGASLRPLQARLWELEREVGKTGKMASLERRAVLHFRVSICGLGLRLVQLRSAAGIGGKDVMGPVAKRLREAAAHGLGLPGELSCACLHGDDQVDVFLHIEPTLEQIAEVRGRFVGEEFRKCIAGGAAGTSGVASTAGHATLRWQGEGVHPHAAENVILSEPTLLDGSRLVVPPGAASVCVVARAALPGLLGVVDIMQDDYWSKDVGEAIRLGDLLLWADWDWRPVNEINGFTIADWIAARRPLALYFCRAPPGERLFAGKGDSSHPLQAYWSGPAAGRRLGDSSAAPPTDDPVQCTPHVIDVVTSRRDECDTGLAGECGSLRDLGIRMDFEVGADIRGLGFVPTGIPPDPVMIRQVDADGWAARMGLAKGDELVRVAEEDVASMSHETLASSLRLRPVTVAFWRESVMHPQDLGSTWRFELLARSDVNTLGICAELDGGPPLRVHAGEVSGWAARHGVQTADKLVEVNMRLVADMTPESLASALGTRPLRLAFERLPEWDHATVVEAAWTDCKHEANEIHDASAPQQLEQFEGGHVGGGWNQEVADELDDAGPAKDCEPWPAGSKSGRDVTGFEQHVGYAARADDFTDELDGAGAAGGQTEGAAPEAVAPDLNGYAGVGAEREGTASPASALASRDMADELDCARVGGGGSEGVADDGADDEGAWPWVAELPPGQDDAASLLFQFLEETEPDDAEGADDLGEDYEMVEAEEEAYIFEAVDPSTAMEEASGVEAGRRELEDRLHRVEDMRVQFESLVEVMKASRQETEAFRARAAAQPRESLLRNALRQQAEVIGKHLESHAEQIEARLAERLSSMEALLVMQERRLEAEASSLTSAPHRPQERTREAEASSVRVVPGTPQDAEPDAELERGNSSPRLGSDSRPRPQLPISTGAANETSAAAAEFAHDADGALPCAGNAPVDANEDPVPDDVSDDLGPATSLEGRRSEYDGSERLPAQTPSGMLDDDVGEGLLSGLDTPVGPLHSAVLEGFVIKEGLDSGVESPFSPVEDSVDEGLHSGLYVPLSPLDGAIEERFDSGLETPLSPIEDAVEGCHSGSSIPATPRHGAIEEGLDSGSEPSPGPIDDAVDEGLHSGLDTPFSPVGDDRAEEPDPGIPTTIRVTAGADVKKLGFVPSAMPPDPVFIKSIDKGSWADQANLREGDELLVVAGYVVVELTLADMKALMRQRPLDLEFAPYVDDGIPSAGMPSRDIWDSPRMSSSPERSKAGATRSGSARVSFSPEPPKVVEARPDEFVLVAGASVGNLGWIPNGFPPDAVVVKSVNVGAWAAEQGLEEGDELIEVNGQSAIEMLKSDLKFAMRSRPLTLRFARGANCGRKQDEMRQIAAKRAKKEEEKAQLQQNFGFAPPISRWGESPLNQPSYIDVTAEEGEEDAELGFLPSAMPPQSVFVKSVKPNSWSDRNGIEVGDELVLAQDNHVVALTPKELKVYMRQRPLKLRFERVAQQLDEDKRDSFLRKVVPPEETDEALADKDNAGPARIVAFAYDEQSLGFKHSGIAPLDTIEVTDVKPQAWAHKNGVLVGDELIAVNGKWISQLTDAKLKKALSKTRPLELTFERPKKRKKKKKAKIGGKDDQGPLAGVADPALFSGVAGLFG